MKIVGPSDRATFSRLQAPTIQVVASDPDGSVVDVEYFGRRKEAGEFGEPFIFGGTSSEPHEVTFNFQPGTYEITVRARDDDDALTVSDPIVFTVQDS